MVNGKGFGIEDARASIETAYEIRTGKIVKGNSNMHPFLEEKHLLNV